jgi:3-oxoacyl-[acyl-carrier-protein] synthase II
MARGDDAVWITGVGVATPLGLTFPEVADNLLAGKSGVRPVPYFDTSDQSCKFAACLPATPLPCPSGFDPIEFATLGTWKQLLLWTGINALMDAGVWDDRSRLRIGLVLGIGAEWVQIWELDIWDDGDRAYNPALDHTSLARYTQETLGVSGPCTTVAAACATGNVALAQARRWVQKGWVDICLAGGCDSPLTPMGMAGFANLGALSKRNEAPELASRPFDRDRDGFVMGEGGALFVLESAARARRRGAKVYGEVAGVGATSDAFHLVIPSTDTVPCARAMRGAIADAGIAPGDLDYVNAHAPSTPVGDAFECKALREVLGESARLIPVSSTKSMTGHMLSAAAAVEAVAALTAFDRQAIPPTINLDNPDPECDLLHVANHAQERKVNTVLSNSFGFGGSNICVVFRRVA